MIFSKKLFLFSLSLQIIISIIAIYTDPKMLPVLLTVLGFNLLLSTLYSGKKTRDTLTKLSNSLTDMKKVDSIISTHNLKDTLVSKITDQMSSLYNELNLAKEKSIKDRDKLEALIGDISHQIKTPITQLNILNKLLEKDYADYSSRKEFNERLSHLNWLIDNLIKFSRVESGLIKVSKKSENITLLLLNSIKRVEKLAKEKNIDIRYSNPLSFTLNVDINWTMEAFYNILDNAVKYSKPNSIITIKAEVRDLYYCINIIDNGIGIAKRDLNRIFERFYRGSDSGKYEGAGIGLSLAQKIMNMQNGYIYCSSQKGKGSQFTICLQKDLTNSNKTDK